MRQYLNTIATLSMVIALSVVYVSCVKSDPPPPPPVDKPEVITRYVSLSTFPKTTVFNSGNDEVNTFRIPTMITSKSGVLIVACEARREKWSDKSATDVAVKRSTDGGLTWSSIQFLTQQSGTEAYMDPCLVSDRTTGRTFLFSTRWESASSSAGNNRTFLSYSDDDGLTWSVPEDVTDQVSASGCRVFGCGPGAGLQMRDSSFPDRLIVPTRQFVVETEKSEVRTLYSDDHGATWQTGRPITPTSELMMAEIGNGELRFNMRSGGKRYVSRSSNGGLDWVKPYFDGTLLNPSKGCQGSVLGSDSVLLFCGPIGGTAVGDTDERSGLTLWRSLNGGDSWGQRYELYANASGYSCMSNLPNGDLVIVFETADSRGFINSKGNRPAGWMRLDVLIIPSDIYSKDCWIKP